MAKFSVEQATWVDNSKYGVVHKAGCKDLKDGLDFEADATAEAVNEAAADETGWSDEDSFKLAPCAQKMLKEA